MQRLTRLSMAISMAWLTGCAAISERGPMRGPETDPLQTVKTLSSQTMAQPQMQQDTASGLGAGPTMMQADIRCPVIMARLKANGVWVGVHDVCVPYQPARFIQPEPSRMTIPVSSPLDARDKKAGILELPVKEEKKVPESKPTGWQTPIGMDKDTWQNRIKDLQDMFRGNP